MQELKKLLLELSKQDKETQLLAEDYMFNFMIIRRLKK
jgi:hypothetical protein